MAKGSRHDEERWEADGKKPAEQIDDPAPTIFAHIGVVMVTTTFGVVMAGMLLLVGLDKMTVAELLEVTKVVAMFLGVAIVALAGTRVATVVSKAARKELR